MAHDLFLEPEVHSARKNLPANYRQRVRTLLDGLASDPRPPKSQPMDMVGLDVPAGVELRRLRLDPWRIVYAVNDAESWVWVLAIRRRPPYEYEDLVSLAARLE